MLTPKLEIQLLTNETGLFLKYILKDLSETLFKNNYIQKRN